MGSIVSGYALADPATGVLSEMEERETISKTAQRAFFANDFAALESTSHQYRVEQSRTASGLWKLTLLYAGIGKALDMETIGDPAVPFKALEQRVRRWQQQYPKSPAAQIAMGLLHISHASAYRGDGYA